MFYVNNKQVLGMFLNGKSYNYIAYGFNRIIPENRNADLTNVNLADKYLSQYRVEYGNIQSGYNNFPIARLDYPVSSIFHSPLTYYYGGNIVPTKKVPVYITNGYCAIRGPVYNDIDINGNIVNFASNSDFKGHNVNIHPERWNSQSITFNGTAMNNCSNFHLNASSNFSKSSQPTLYNCINFSGNFKYVGSGTGTRCPGFRGFLHTCRDGVFNFDLRNMDGGGSDANVTNYFSFSCISNCNNIRLNITGSPWQAWVHPYCESNNCNITTRYIVPGFDSMRNCNFNLSMPSYADVEKSKFYSILSNSSNCNVYFDGLNSNLSSFRNVSQYSFLFDGLNNCNLNLLLNNSNGLGYHLGSNLNNCNIHFENLSFAQRSYCWGNMNKCNIDGNVTKADYDSIDLVAYSTNVNLNVNASSTNNFSLIWNSSYINGNVILGKRATLWHSNNLILNLYNGNTFVATNVSSSEFELNNVKNVTIQGAYSTNFYMYNATGTAILKNLNNVDFVERGRANYTISNIDNCNKSWIYANTVNGLIENVYNSRIELKNNNSNFRTMRVNNCEITGFPTSSAYTTNCTFKVSIPQALFRNSSYITWANVWPHATPRGSDGFNPLYRTKAGLESTANLSQCYLNCNDGSLLYFDYRLNFNNSNNMQCDITTFHNGIVTANLPNYNMNIKLNVDCNTLNLGVFQAGPPHGFEHSSISADNIFCTTGTDYYVQMNYGTRIYCENFCNVPFSPAGFRFSDNYQPVLLINNYKHSNSQALNLRGGIYRFGRLNYRGGMPPIVNLSNGACMFINNAGLSDITVDNALLFVGTKVHFAGDVTVTNGGLIVNKANYSMSAIGKFVNRNNFTWNFQDSGPWGPRSLLDYCTNV